MALAPISVEQRKERKIYITSILHKIYPKQCSNNVGTWASYTEHGIVGSRLRNNTHKAHASVRFEHSRQDRDHLGALIDKGRDVQFGRLGEEPVLLDAWQSRTTKDRILGQKRVPP